MSPNVTFEEKWTALTAGFDSVGFVLREDGEYEDVFYNEETGSLLYGEPGEIEGGTLHDHLPDTLADGFQEVVRETIRAGEPQSHEYKLELDGDTRWFDALVSPLPDNEDREHRYVLWMARDITDRKHREFDLQRYKTIVEQSGDLIYIADDNGCFNYVNEAFAKALGYEREEILGEHAELVMEQADIETGRELISSLLSSSEVRGTFEMDLITADGVRIPCENHIVLLPFDDEYQGSAGVLRDITERKEREQQLAVLDRVLRHNLRNDMNLIIGNAGEIARRSDGEISETAQQIAKSGKELLDLVDKERELADLISSSPSQGPYNLAACLLDPLTQLDERYPEADIDVSIPEDINVIAIPQLSQAVTELGQNAIQHSDQEIPSLTIDVERGDERVTIRIADDGPGLPDKERKVLTGEKEIGPLYHGRGMGLRLVDWIVTLAGGRLTVEDNEPRGTVVKINLARTNRQAETQQKS